MVLRWTYGACESLLEVDLSLTFLSPSLYSGVNMYAMLTGFLPYTVDPFNITALHAKMLENKMNPIPTTLTPGRPYTSQTVLLVMCLTHSLCVCV